MSAADKLLTQIKEDREIRAKAVNVVNLSENSGGRAIEFIEHAVRTWERKNRQLEIAVETANRILRKVPHKTTREEAADMAIEFQHELRKALEDMEAVK
ncbi:MAG: hypothetical protein KF767_08775 [Bdellovibrionaceae bacterium]|nr:hypothetical protein [Pseudobdellovibrionaceae bacterium]